MPAWKPKWAYGAASRAYKPAYTPLIKTTAKTKVVFLRPSTLILPVEITDMPLEDEALSVIRIFACEAQPVSVEGLKKILGETSDLELAGWASSHAESLLRIPELNPDLVIADQGSGLKDLFTFLPQLRAASPSSRVVLWVNELVEAEGFRALQMGARGILRRNLPIATLLECLRSVGQGNLWLEHSISDQVVNFLNRKNSARLTPREREIVRAVSRGLKNKEIAELLHITAGTVKVHLMHVFEKTGVKDRFELAMQGPKLLGLEREELSPSL